jgi:hypothetical protein
MTPGIRRWFERLRVRVFIEMTRAGASKSEAFTFIDLMYPLEDVDV